MGRFNQSHDNEIPIVPLSESSATSWADEDPDHLGWYQLFAGFAGLLWVTVVAGVVVRNRGDARTGWGWDLRIARWTADHRTTWMTRLATDVSVAGSTPVLISGTAVLGVLVWRHGRHSGTAALPLLALVDTEVVVQIAKRIVARPRPPASLASAGFDGLTWPSGHAASATAVSASICVVATAIGLGPAVRRRIRWTVGSLAVLVASSGIALGAHWTSDVLMGGVVGAAVVALLAQSLLSDHTSRSPDPGYDDLLVPPRADL